MKCKKYGFKSSTSRLFPVTETAEMDIWFYVLLCYFEGYTMTHKNMSLSENYALVIF